MKWGVRKDRSRSSTSSTRRKTTSSRKKTSRAKSKRSITINIGGKPRESKAKSVKDMTDAELRAKINRLQMEKQYSDLTKKQVSRGAKFISDVAGQSAKAVATKYTTQAMTSIIDGVLDAAKKKK